MSIDMNLAPLWLSDMTLLTNNLASKRDAAGDESSARYSSTSPPIVSRTLYGSFLSGQ